MQFLIDKSQDFELLDAATKNLYKSHHYREEHQNASQAVLLTIHVLESHQYQSGFLCLKSRVYWTQGSISIYRPNVCCKHRKKE